MKDENRVKAFVKFPGIRAIFPMSIKNELEEYQGIVDGYIEAVTMHRKTGDVIAIVNEEGLINDMKYNCRFNGHQLFGPVILVGENEDGDFVDAPITLKEAHQLLDKEV